MCYFSYHFLRRSEPTTINTVEFAFPVYTAALDKVCESVATHLESVLLWGVGTGRAVGSSRE
jgi:hypothetical protein